MTTAAPCPECGRPKKRRSRAFCSRKCYWADWHRRTPPRICKIEGCNGTQSSLELCEKHYQRHKNYGRTWSRRDLSPAERFWEKVDKTDPSGCWPWVGRVNNKGYGRFVVSSARGNEVRALAHRFSYELATGEDIAGRVVMHTCDNPPCVNPAHLRAGTQLDNIRDCLAKGRMNLDGLALGWELRRQAGTTVSQRQRIREKRAA